jgi:putative transposase
LVSSPAGRELAEQLVEQARAEGVDLVGPGDLLGDLTKRVLEAGLEAEMTDHLGYDKHDPAGRDGGNSRNGTRTKTVITDVRPVELDVPRDRDSSFQPKLVRKRQRRLGGVDEMVISLTAKGPDDRRGPGAPGRRVRHRGVPGDDLQDHDAILGEMADWMSRPLERVYPVGFIDALFVKIRDGQVTNRPHLHRHRRHRRWPTGDPRAVGRHRRRGRQVLAPGAHRAAQPWCRGRVHGGV